MGRIPASYYYPMDAREKQLYQFLGTRLRERRHSLHMTQADLAIRVGLLRSSVANIEAGRQRITVHVLYDLCQALNLDVSTALPAPVLVESREAAQ